MRNCATCKHINKNDSSNWCRKHNKFHVHPSQIDIVSCESYQEHREPLRLACECRWEEASDGDSLFFVPTIINGYNLLSKFKGKRTRMVIEEIVG